MRDTKTGLQHLISDESGQDLIEYALIAGVMALGSIATLGLLTRNLGNVFSTVGNTLTSGV
jgi:pilus assembly protein Flp/PilA